MEANGLISHFEAYPNASIDEFIINIDVVIMNIAASTIKASISSLRSNCRRGTFITNRRISEKTIAMIIKTLKISVESEINE